MTTPKILNEKIEKLTYDVSKLNKRLKRDEKKCLGEAEEIEKKKREPSEYNLFVKEFVNSMPADSPKERLSLCAMAYAEYKKSGKKPKKLKK